MWIRVYYYGVIILNIIIIIFICHNTISIEIIIILHNAFNNLWAYSGVFYFYSKLLLITIGYPSNKSNLLGGKKSQKSLVILGDSEHKYLQKAFLNKVLHYERHCIL